MPGCYACGSEVSDSHQFCPFCGVSEPIPSTPSCPNCAQNVEQSWVNCPMCGVGLQSGPAPSQPLSYQTAPVSTPAYTPTTPVFSSQPPTQQVTLTTSPSVYSQQTYAPPPYSQSEGSPMLWVGGITVLVVILIVVALVFAFSDSSKGTWSGDIDSRLTDSGPWHTYNEDCETMTTIEFRSNGKIYNDLDCLSEDIEMVSWDVNFDWPLDITTVVMENTETGDTGKMEAHFRHHIVDGVWFEVMEYAYIDGTFYSSSELGNAGACVASVADDTIKDSGSGYTDRTAWSSAVGNVIWPNFCDSVEGY